MSLINLAEQRFMVSPCGFYSDYFHVSEIADEAPGWTDCSELSDVEVGELINRRMRQSGVPA